MRAMLDKNTIIGILISSANMELNIQIDEKVPIGYFVRCRLNIRDDEKMLKWLQRDLLSFFNVKSSLLLSESSQRNKPILRISGIKNMKNLIEQVPQYLQQLDNWGNFCMCVNILYDREHKTLEGLEKLMKIKGVL